MSNGEILFNKKDALTEIIIKLSFLFGILIISILVLLHVRANLNYRFSEISYNSSYTVPEIEDINPISIRDNPQHLEVFENILGRNTGNGIIIIIENVKDSSIHINIGR